MTSFPYAGTLRVSTRTQTSYLKFNIEQKGKKQKCRRKRHALVKKYLNMQSEMNTEEERIKKVISDMEAAWNSHDAKAYAHVFAEDADFTNVFGQKSHGRAAIEQFHAPMFQAMFKASHFTTNQVSVRLVSENLAAVDVTWEMSGVTDPSGNPLGNRKGLMNLLMKKESGTWAILIMHNMDLPAIPNR